MRRFSFILDNKQRRGNYSQSALDIILNKNIIETTLTHLKISHSLLLRLYGASEDMNISFVFRIGMEKNEKGYFFVAGERAQVKSPKCKVKSRSRKRITSTNNLLINFALCPLPLALPPSMTSDKRSY